MAKGAEAGSDSVPRKRMGPGDRHEEARKRLEATPHYWIARGQSGMEWTKQAGRDAAMAALGPIVPGTLLMCSTAGLALRLAEVRAEYWNVDIDNGKELQAAAHSDPEPDSGSKRAWDLKKATK